MKEYYYYDTDIEGEKEYDICGNAYKKLMEACCQYSTTLCLKFLSPNLKAAELLSPFEITRPTNIAADFCVYGGYCVVKYYRVCPELCEVLQEIATSIFQWLLGWGFRNPDDPMFFRSDGSVFFASEIHEGVCVLLPKEDEDVDEVLVSANWLTDDPRTLGPNLLRTIRKTGTA